MYHKVTPMEELVKLCEGSVLSVCVCACVRMHYNFMKIEFIHGMLDLPCGQS